MEVSGSLSSILGRSRVGTLGPDARKVLGVIESQVNWLRNFVESNRQSMTQKAEWNNKQLQQAMTRYEKFWIENGCGTQVQPAGLIGLV